MGDRLSQFGRLNQLSEMASQFPGWCNTEALEDLYIDAKVAGADGAILSSERTARRYLNARGVSEVSIILVMCGKRLLSCLFSVGAGLFWSGGAPAFRVFICVLTFTCTSAALASGPSAWWSGIQLHAHPRHACLAVSLTL